MNSYFKGKTVIVTGASAGVGAACARAFAAAGSNLVLVARGQTGLDSMAAELSTEVKVLTVVMDVRNTDQCMELIEKANAEFGQIDILINNAGLHHRGDVTSVKSEDIGAMVDINLRAPLILSSAVLPFLRLSRGGAIVMIGSLAGMAPLQGAATYSATKAGLRAFAYAFSEELRESNINVGVVSPGPVDTGFIMNEIDNVEDIVFSQPMSSANDVAEAVLAIARGEKTEISLPSASGKLATLSYLFPGLRRFMRPKLYAKGLKNKDKYRNKAKSV
ncbi:MAG: SDR family NAD(P)-dependent oxidoreductase [Porticoccaceae bacterium]|nr:SDR family NAD(P)-dependent oxidoreductase [Porticoccaceae bacterium]